MKSEITFLLQLNVLEGFNFQGSIKEKLRFPRFFGETLKITQDTTAKDELVVHYTVCAPEVPHTPIMFQCHSHPIPDPVMQLSPRTFGYRKALLQSQAADEYS